MHAARALAGQLYCNVACILLRSFTGNDLCMDHLLATGTSRELTTMQQYDCSCHEPIFYSTLSLKFVLLTQTRCMPGIIASPNLTCLLPHVLVLPLPYRRLPAPRTSRRPGILCVSQVGALGLDLCFHILFSFCAGLS